MYKHSQESEGMPLIVSPSVIVFDGPDGVGKSTLARALYDKLIQIKGRGNVVLTEATNVKGSIGQDKLQTLRGKYGLGSRENTFYAAGVNRAYRDIVLPAVHAGKIVVIDRSELDLIRFSIEHQNHDLDKRLNYIRSGILTLGIAPGTRILIHSSPEDIWKNLTERSCSSSYDPQSLNEVIARVEAQRKAERAVLAIMPCPTVLKMYNPRILKTELEQYLSKTTGMILHQLPSQLTH